MARAIVKRIGSDDDWVSYTPVFNGFGAVSSVDIKSRRDGSDLLIRGVVTLGTRTGVTADMSLPLALMVASDSASPEVCGSAVWDGSTTTSYILLCTASQGAIQFSHQNNAGLTANSGTALFTDGSTIAIEARVPIEGWNSTS